MFRGKEMYRFVLVLSVAILIATAAMAQVTTGRLIGTITDQNAVPLPGVTVTVNSESLLGGQRSAVSDAAGEFSILGLPVGIYTVNASLPGFVTQERNEVKVPLGGAASVLITMPDGGTFEDEIEVTAETPVVDPTQVAMEQTFDAEYLQNAAIGSANRSYQNMLYQAAGSDDSSESAGNPSVFGSTSGENTYYIDGMDTTDPITSTFAANFNFDAIQEVQFQTAGFEAEYGRTIGGVVNLVTKSGGNQFSGTFDARYRNESSTKVENTTTRTSWMLRSWTSARPSAAPSCATSCGSLSPTSTSRTTGHRPFPQTPGHSRATIPSPSSAGRPTRAGAWWASTRAIR